MRTTPEARDEHRRKLLQIAVQRVQHAIEAIGKVGADEARRLEKEAKRLRRSWR